MTGLAFPAFKAMYYSGSMTFPSEMTVFVEQLLETPRSFFLCGALLYALSVAGAVIMWNLRKSGFHLYTLAQLLIPVVTILFLGKESLALGDIMFTLLFIVFYYVSLRNLDVFNKSDKEQDELQQEDNQQ